MAADKAPPSIRWMVTDKGDGKIAKSAGVLGSIETPENDQVYVPLYSSGEFVELSEQTAAVYRENGWVTSVKG